MNKNDNTSRDGRGHDETQQQQRVGISSDDTEEAVMAMMRQQPQQQQLQVEGDRPSTTRMVGTRNSSQPPPLKVSEMEKLTSKARMSLSFQERTRAMEDLHGISSRNNNVSTSEVFSQDQHEQKHRQMLLTAMGLEIKKQQRMRREQQQGQTNILDQKPPSHQHVNAPLPEQEHAYKSDDDDESKSSDVVIDDQEEDIRWSFVQSCCHHDTRLTAELMKLDPKYMNHVVEQATCKYLQYQDQKMHTLPLIPSTSTTISYNDLTPTSRDIVRSGWFQLLPETDQAGRKIIGIFPHQLPSSNPTQELRSELLQAAFFFWSYIQFPHNNRDCVLIYYDPSGASSQDNPRFNTMQEVLGVCCQCLPIRLVALHIVQNPTHTSTSPQQLPMFWRTLTPSLQVRTAFHFVDTAQDLKRELQRFGIRITLVLDTQVASVVKTSISPSSPTDAIEFPIDIHGNMHLQQHTIWLQKSVDENIAIDDTTPYQSMDVPQPTSSRNSAATIKPSVVQSTSSIFVPAPDAVIPDDKDVLFGRGMAIQKHKGNIAFRNRLTPNVDAYYQADNVEKVILVDFLLHQFQSEGVRFLKHEMASSTASLPSSSNEPGPTPSSSDPSSLDSSRTSASAGVTPSVAATSVPSSQQQQQLQQQSQELLFSGRWTVVQSKQTIYSKFCQTFRSIRAAQRRQQKNQERNKL